MSLIDDPQVRRNVDRLPIAFDDYGFDRFGLSKKTLVRAYSPVAYMYRHYLKVTAFGLENVPATGRALLIANHSGGIGADAAMIMTSLLLNDEAPRLGQGMADYFLTRSPFARPFLRKVGHLTGIPEHGEQLLADERLVVVFPEGARGAGKLFFLPLPDGQTAVSRDGGARRDRTDDLMLAKHALSQLSYGPVHKPRSMPAAWPRCVLVYRAV